MERNAGLGSKRGEQDEEKAGAGAGAVSVETLRGGVRSGGIDWVRENGKQGGRGKTKAAADVRAESGLRERTGWGQRLSQREMGREGRQPQTDLARERRVGMRVR